MLIDSRNALTAAPGMFTQCLGTLGPTKLTGRIYNHSVLGSEIMDRAPGSEIMDRSPDSEAWAPRRGGRRGRHLGGVGVSQVRIPVHWTWDAGGSWPVLPVVQSPPSLAAVTRAPLNHQPSLRIQVPEEAPHLGSGLSSRWEADTLFC